MTNLDQHYQTRQQNIIEQRFYCNLCKKAFRDEWTLINHLNSLKHKPRPQFYYHCEPCNYSTTKRNCATQHQNTKKHKLKIIELPSKQNPI